jgi:thymidylate synthase ThyX
MQPGDVLPPEVCEAASKVWAEAHDSAVSAVKKLAELGVHKQITNRLLEPFTHIDVVLSSTRWNNFFALRKVGAGAQHEIDVLATAIAEAMRASSPKVLLDGVWHLPFLSEEEVSARGVEACIRSSVARCARVSYRKHDATETTPEDDDRLYYQLLTSSHLSPFEHQARAGGDTGGNFGPGWTQYRKTFPADAATET